MNKTVKLLLYCTKAMPALVYFGYGSKEYRYFGYDKKSQNLVFEEEGFNPNDISQYLNGKIVAEAECELVEKIKFINDSQYGTNTLNQNDLLKETCIGMLDLYEYMFIKDGYAIHLKNVKPFKEPKELSEYYQHISIKDYEKMFNCEVDLKDEKLNKDKYNKNSYMRVPIKRASQNMMYCYDKDGNIYVLISIQAPHMCNIMNDLKTIEVRTSIVNLLKELIPNENN